MTAGPLFPADRFLRSSAIERFRTMCADDHFFAEMADGTIDLHDAGVVHALIEIELSEVESELDLENGIAEELFAALLAAS
ncbi:MAG: hypothetical protein ACYC0X_21145 [Pirellulaceae bacterium]